MELQATDMQLFFDLLKRKKRKRKNSDGKYSTVCDAYVHKVMRHIKTYVKRLAEKLYLKHLAPIEVPNVKQPHSYPGYLTKNELSLILQHLEDALITSKKSNNECLLYSAYLRRAMVWFLYTTGLRNFEIRKLRLQDLRLDSLAGTILGKGDKLAVFTYNAPAKEKLLAYLAIRKKIFP